MTATTSPDLSQHMIGLPRRISAMLRLRNEEEFLEAAVESIAGAVDHIVLVDNLSSDGTVAIAKSLQAKYPQKLTLDLYPYPILRVGRETWEAADQGTSPHLSSAYYNYCLDRCREPFVLKWDGDMIARPAFAAALEQWRQGDAAILRIYGQNVHPDRRHLLAARRQERESLLSGLSVPGLPSWATVLTRDFAEPRLFPRRWARYDCAIRWTQHLSTPYLDKSHRGRFERTADEACYLHMKFCKRDPMSNYSQDLGQAILGNASVGPELSLGDAQILSRFGHGAPS